MRSGIPEAGPSHPTRRRQLNETSNNGANQNLSMQQTLRSPAGECSKELIKKMIEKHDTCNFQMFGHFLSV